MELVAAMKRGDVLVTELCRQFGVSRETAYKWKRRYDDDGADGLSDRSRAPRTHPNAISDAMRERILALRRKRPHEGPKKIRVRLLAERSNEPVPAASTIGSVLDEEQLTVTRPPRRRPTAWVSTSLIQPVAPNHVWSADFKGHFQLATGEWCYPLTITDNFSRMLFRCAAHRSIELAATRRVFESCYAEYGLPLVLRTDNGTPFASNRGDFGLTSLSLWCLKLGITLERIDPGCPQQNGRHEKMHRTLKAQTVSPAASSFADQQARFDEFRRYYNEDRPHESLGQVVPASKYAPSFRPLPKHLEPFEYPGWATRRVHSNGYIEYARGRYRLSKALRGENVGLQPIDDGLLTVWLGRLNLGNIDLRARKFTARQCA